MFRKRYHLMLTYEEIRLILGTLFYRREQMIEEGRFTDPVDELIIKFMDKAA